MACRVSVRLCHGLGGCGLCPSSLCTHLLIAVHPPRFSLAHSLPFLCASGSGVCLAPSFPDTYLPNPAKSRISIRLLPMSGWQQRERLLELSIQLLRTGTQLSFDICKRYAITSVMKGITIGSKQPRTSGCPPFPFRRAFRCPRFPSS